MCYNISMGIDIEKRRARMREHYRNNKASYRTRDTNRRKHIRELIRSIKRGKVCANCGFADPRALDFHHTNPENKIAEVSQLYSHRYSDKKILDEVKKCILLCANCHRIEHSVTERY